jgi:superfamily II DNA or RNA helicase
MDDENIYGKTIASVSAIKARELKRICPYKTITIKTTPIKIDFNIEHFFQENNLKEKQKKRLLELKDRYIMFAKGLIDCIKLHDIKHIITFHEYIINCKFFCKILEEINKQENLLKYIKCISGNDNKKIRDNMIYNFQTQNFSILCSAKVLQEGVDIPNCDGVIFIDNKTSNIDITQSFSRCLTYLDEKEAYIMIPYEDGVDLIDDEKTNDLRLLLRNISEIDENIKEYFKEYNEINFENKTKEEKETEMKLLNIKYNISVELDFVNEMKEISYLPFKMAKDLIKGKYCDLNDYKNNINDFSKELPINPDEIYKRFGWKNWNDYLGQSNEMTLGKISKIIKSENENRKNKIKNLTIRTAIKYTLLKFGQKTAKEIYEIICKENLLPQLQGKTPSDSVTSHCYTMGNEGLIEKIGNNPIIFLFNGYNEFELIDNKEKYIQFCKNKANYLPENIEPENGNWIKFCLNNYDDLITNHYSIEELKILNFTNIDNYISRTKIDSKLISYDYICSGFYNNKNHFNILSIINPSEEYIE